MTKFPTNDRRSMEAPDALNFFPHRASLIQSVQALIFLNEIFSFYF